MELILNKSVGAFSAGTRVEPINQSGDVVEVRTRSPIRYVRQETGYDAQGSAITVNLDRGIGRAILHVPVDHLTALRARVR